MSYYDKSSVGRLVTRTVSDMETIASIFSQGLFMIFADLILMFSVLIVMIVFERSTISNNTYYFAFCRASNTAFSKSNESCF